MVKDAVCRNQVGSPTLEGLKQFLHCPVKGGDDMGHVPNRHYRYAVPTGWTGAKTRWSSSVHSL